MRRQNSAGLLCNPNVMRSIRLQLNARRLFKEHSRLHVLNRCNGHNLLLVLNQLRGLSLLRVLRLRQDLRLRHVQKLHDQLLLLGLRLLRVRHRHLVRLRRHDRRSITKVGVLADFYVFRRSDGRCATVQITVIYGEFFTVDYAVASWISKTAFRTSMTAATTQPAT